MEKLYSEAVIGKRFMNKKMVKHLILPAFLLFSLTAGNALVSFASENLDEPDAVYYKEDAKGAIDNKD